jgi:hypothetical protein
MGIAAIAWMVGNVIWLAGQFIPDAVPWWVAFLVLTIVGERLELCRFLPPTPARQPTFVAAAGLYLAGVTIGRWWPGAGWTVAGVGLLALSAWLVTYDLARRTVRQQGLTRFAAVCLLSGYSWLVVGGGLAVWHEAVSPLLNGSASTILQMPLVAGLAYDAILHAVLLGFVFAMIFGHAPIIFPAVLGIGMEYRPRFYGHLVLLQGSVGLRIICDLAGWWDGRRWAGLLNAAAVVLFLLNTGCPSAGSRRARGHCRRRAGTGVNGFHWRSTPHSRRLPDDDRTSVRSIVRASDEPQIVQQPARVQTIRACDFVQRLERRHDAPDAAHPVSTKDSRSVGVSCQHFGDRTVALN